LKADRPSWINWGASHDFNPELLDQGLAEAVTLNPLLLAVEDFAEKERVEGFQTGQPQTGPFFFGSVPAFLGIGEERLRQIDQAMPVGKEPRRQSQRPEVGDRGLLNPATSSGTATEDGT
jgi:hypothetical protein